MTLYSPMRASACAWISAGHVRPWPPEGSAADTLAHHVDGDAERTDDALAEPVIGDVAQTETLTCSYAQLANGPAAELDVSACNGALTGDGLGQRPLTVAVDAGHADHLAGVHGEREHRLPHRPRRAFP